MTFVRKRHTALKTVVSILATIVAFWVMPVGLKSCAKEALIEAQTPLWTALRNLDELQDEAALKTSSKEELIALIQELSSTQKGLELRLQTLEAAENDRARLEGLLRMPPFYGYETRAARVLRRDLNGYWQQLWIDAGSAHKIKRGMGVICKDGVVGRVREVYEQSAVVELISSPTFRIAAQIQGDDRPFVYRGRGLAFGEQPVGQTQAMQPEMALKQGESKWLVTTGLSGSFPEGITIGKLIQTDSVSEGGLLEGSVELSKNLEKLRQVTLLIPNR